MALDSIYLIITGIFFIIGFLISYLLKSKHTTVIQPNSSPTVDYSEIINVIENNKQLQIDNIMQKINDIEIKLDLVESMIFQLSKKPQIDTNATDDNKNITQIPKSTSQDKISSDINYQISQKTSQSYNINKNPIVLSDKQNATNYYILKILSKESLTSNDIKNAIGRTREHTSRLMKKLFEENFVYRDITTKPFKYRLTEQGKKYLEEQLTKNDFKSSSSSNNTLFDLTR